MAAKEKEAKKRAEAKRLGMTYREYREMRSSKYWEGQGRKKPDTRLARRDQKEKVPSVREVHDQLIEAQPFIRELKTLEDTGRTRPMCPTCKRHSDFDDYFCIHCGEHFDWLYCYEHANAPIELTREQIMAEYAEAGRPFRSQNYDAGQLKFHSVADLLGINYYARMPVETHKEEDRWKGLQGFRREESSLTT